MDLQDIMSMRFRDRITCSGCKKEVVSTDGRPVQECPHCGASLHWTDWMLEENIKEVAKALKAEGAEGKAAAVALLLKVQGSGDIKDRIKSLTTARRYDEALKACDDGLAINPRDAWIMKEKGVALVLLGRPLEGIKCFDRLIASFPHIGYGWYAKGLALCELGKREEGFECFKKAEALGSEEAKLALRHYQGQSR